MNVYSFKAADARGQELSLASFAGKTLLIVNVASKCGLTPQYAGLQQLYSQWNTKGLEILGFPCDQFGHQEPGSNEEIQQFCQVNYNVSFPVLAKIEVNGADAHPLYAYLTAQKSSPNGPAIQWNFTKFLVDRAGGFVERFEPKVTPEEIAPHIARLIES